MSCEGAEGGVLVPEEPVSAASRFVVKDLSNGKVWDFLMYVTCAVLVFAASRVEASEQVYGMINLMIGAVLREIGGRK